MRQKHLYRGALTYICHQSDANFGGHMGYRRANDLLLWIRFGEGTSNHLGEGDNEGADEEEDAAEEEVARAKHGVQTWGLPPSSSFKLNVDGACNLNFGLAFLATVARDEHCK
ncbi:hypothetical protein J1N35_029445 [Gossypium stocksii]|uniref:Uncharacterized protein n=1 Tax=Gossypium stocksii TaxID=47602 RepID=A0A9D3UXS7_9ROSI|nr:hypothetical protein J1N35_029445 [Gossypium stocksii]